MSAQIGRRRCRRNSCSRSQLYSEELVDLASKVKAPSQILYRWDSEIVSLSDNGEGPPLGKSPDVVRQTCVYYVGFLLSLNYVSAIRLRAISTFLSKFECGCKVNVGNVLAYSNLSRVGIKSAEIIESQSVLDCFPFSACLLGLDSWTEELE